MVPQRPVRGEPVLSAIMQAERDHLCAHFYCGMTFAQAKDWLMERDLIEALAMQVNLTSEAYDRVLCTQGYVQPRGNGELYIVMPIERAWSNYYAWTALQDAIKELGTDESAVGYAADLRRASMRWEPPGRRRYPTWTSPRRDFYAS